VCVPTPRWGEADADPLSDRPRWGTVAAFLPVGLLIVGDPRRVDLFATELAGVAFPIPRKRPTVKPRQQLAFEYFALDLGLYQVLSDSLILDSARYQRRKQEIWKRNDVPKASPAGRHSYSTASDGMGSLHQKHFEPLPHPAHVTPDLCHCDSVQADLLRISAACSEHFNMCRLPHFVCQRNRQRCGVPAGHSYV
jgi:hypothetical protein